MLDVIPTLLKDLQVDLPGLDLKSVFIATATFSLLASLGAYYRRPRTPKLKGPPGQSLLFGVTRELFEAPDLGVLYRAWEQTYGPVYEVPSSLGSKMIVLGDPKAVAEFFSKDTSTYHQPSLQKVISRQMLGDMLLIVEGETHKRQRRALSSAFSVSAIRNMTSVFFESAHTLQAAWDASFQSKSDNSAETLTIDVQKWMNYVSLDSIGNGGFSHDFGSLKGEKSPVMTAFDSFGDIKPSLSVMLTFVIGPVLPTFFAKLPNKRRGAILELVSSMEKIAGELLGRAEREKAMGVEVDKSILGALLRSESASSNVQLSVDEIISQMHLFMIAGYETTAITITWALIELARNPEMQEKLRAEMRQHFSAGEDPTYDQLMHELPYLDAFTCETLRVHPAGPELMRTANENDTLPLTQPITTASGEVIDSLFVAKGTTIRVPIAGINTSETLWGDDATTFDPERWIISEDNPKKESQRKEEVQGYRHLLTFAHGPRTCLGRSFALIEFKAVLSVLVRNYSFELPYGPRTEISYHQSILKRPKIAGEEGPRVPLVVRKLTVE